MSIIPPLRGMAYASRGLVKIKDILTHPRLLPRRAFSHRQRYPVVFLPYTLPFPYRMFDIWAQCTGRVKYPVVPVYPVQPAVLYCLPDIHR
jgi:hypothetical protein